jgi:poly(A) polymerase
MERFQEDPVRMLRAIALGARLGFSLDPPVARAIRKQRHLMALASPARLIEEYYKILRSGYAEPTFQALAEHRLLEPVTPELQEGASDEGFRDALDALDTYRQRFDTAPPTLTNAILLGTLLVPLGLMPRRTRHADADDRADPGEEAGADLERLAAAAGRRRRELPKEPVLKIGVLPVARRDTERLRQILSLQRRLEDLESTPRAKRALLHRSPFEEALTWLEVHGRAPEIVEHWRGFMEAVGGLPPEPGVASGDLPEEPRGGRRRRGRRRRGGRRFRGGDGGGGTS